MNLVAVLIAPAIVQLSVGENASEVARYGISIVAVVIIVVAVAVSKRRSIAISDANTDGDDDGTKADESEPARIG